jgi:hypothetical protein
MIGGFIEGIDCAPPRFPKLWAATDRLTRLCVKKERHGSVTILSESESEKIRKTALSGNDTP